MENCAIPGEIYKLEERVWVNDCVTFDKHTFVQFRITEEDGFFNIVFDSKLQLLQSAALFKSGWVKSMLNLRVSPLK
ncbi:hypothetical protein A0J61_02649 [Choanephora cucurbitarum]|uniref:Uncharacterized protein n=1 Tax=Choanephora cucurbitarum TaxID=101091 RepID=A0A1C7NJR9_9FUNG|nr:hypothetical protein A0J61_02649 [Choanephora cucurbitarum]